MTPQETAQIITILRAAYPRQAITAKQYGDMVTVWAGVLADVSFEVGKRAIDEHCRESKWFPSVAEIRDVAIGTREMQEAADRRMAEKLRISGHCCPECHIGPMVHDHCPHCAIVLETEAADVPQLE